MIKVRRAGSLDARPMVDLLNEIIQQGGTTAISQPWTTEDMRTYITAQPETSAWHLAEDEQGEVLGFQWINRIDSLPPEAASIATFAKVGKTGLGIGSALFKETEQAARQLGYSWINADIRADNMGGLAYYQSRGFEDYAIKKDVRLSSGLVVDKVLKRFNL